MHGRATAIGILLGVLASVGLPGQVPAQELAALSPPAPARLAPVVPMFGTREFHYSGLAPFARWTALLARWEHEQEDATESCLSTHDAAPPCPPREWTELIVRFRGLPLRVQIEGVNAAINAHPYVSALANWGDPSRWETPFEFLCRNGQCQDYAITKFLLLRALGVPNDALRLVVPRDIRRQVDHAVLVVTVAGRPLMLDNLASYVVSATANPDYRAYYSINETGWWLHLPNPLTPQTLPRQVASR
ncbi:MAG: transglutaminase-like cysteine peptidase [Stellaceae bacterium]